MSRANLAPSSIASDSVIYRPSAEGTTGVAVVARMEGPIAIVRLSSGVEARARRAVSCLVEPRQGDAALVAVTETGATYVIALLEREENAGVKLVADGDVEIEVGGGKLALTGRDGVSVASATKVSLASPEIEMKSVITRVVSSTLDVIAGTANANIARARTAANVLETVADRLLVRARNAIREVSERDITRAECVDLSARETMKITAKNAVVHAEGLVKMDGDQIHLG